MVSLVDVWSSRDSGTPIREPVDRQESGRQDGCRQKGGCQVDQGVGQVGESGSSCWLCAVGVGNKISCCTAVIQALMPLAPGYGETPLPHDELAALRPDIVGILDALVTRAAVYDLEQGVQDQLSEELMTAAIEGSLLLDELLSDHFIRDLHLRLYADIWVWAGRLRQCEVRRARRGGTGSSVHRRKWPYDKTSR